MFKRSAPFKPWLVKFGYSCTVTEEMAPWSHSPPGLPTPEEVVPGGVLDSEVATPLGVDGSPKPVREQLEGKCSVTVSLPIKLSLSVKRV